MNRILLIIILLFVSQLICAQQVNHTVTISGPTIVCPGAIQNFYSTDYAGSASGTWSPTWGTISGYGQNNTVWIQWTKSGSVSFHAEETICETVQDPPYVGSGGCGYDEYWNYFCDWVYPQPYDVCTLHVYDGYLAISVVGIPTVNPPAASICAGQVVTLAASQHNGATYQWKKDGVLISGATNQTFNASQQGVYTVTTCGGTSAGIPITVNLQPPVASIQVSSLSQMPGSSLLTSSVGSGYSFQWQLNGVDMVGKTNSTCVAEASGSYTVKLISAAGCTSTSTSRLVTISAVPAYVGSTKVLINGITSESQIENLTIPASQISQSFSYVDKLGRPLQTLHRQSTPLGKDLVSFKVFDVLGRQSKSYLPYSSSQTTGLYVDNILGASSYTGSLHYNLYNTSGDKIADDPQPYSQTIFELNPLNRVSQQGSIGAYWQPTTGVPKAITYSTNSANEVKKWTIIALGNFKFSHYYTFYDANELSVTTSTDEQGLVSKQYQDFEGKTISTKTQVSSTVWAETGYVYDDRGDLRSVIPPEAISKVQQQVEAAGMPSSYILVTQNTNLNPDFQFTPTTYLYLEGVTVTLSPSVLSNSFLPPTQIRPYPQAVTSNSLSQYAYQYLYDNLHRKIAEKTPGTDWKYFIYDNRDQLVLSQDGNQRLINQYSFTKYDDLGRPVLSGLTTITGTIDQVRATVDSQTTLNEQIGSAVLGYTNNAYPTLVYPTQMHIWWPPIMTIIQLAFLAKMLIFNL
jgi:hypothetical protein